MKPFSNINRTEHLSRLEEASYDLIVIGGGITGAGILLDAASRGMKTLLLEMGDFASGTSSKSTKLIHGGLRYLKQFDFWLVKEVGSERAIVHQLAPHLVIPEKMLLPLIENGSYGKWLTSIGLKVYDILAQVEGDDQRRMLEKEEALEKEPLLPEKLLKGAGYYAEYRTDDARLTLEIIKTALNYEAEAINYMKVTEFTYKDEKVSGVIAKDEVTGKSINIRSDYIINATGPWVDELRSLNNSKKGKQLHLTKGVHVVFPYEKLPVKQSVYFDVPDGRMIFAIPRGRVTYVGTTDTNYNDQKEQVHTDIADAIYLISAVNNMFPSINLEMEDIISSWAGLRPLIHEEGKSPTELSRKDEIFTSDSGLVSIAGGKLTGYRKMAERVVDRIAEKYRESREQEFNPCITDSIDLCGGPWKKGYKEVLQYEKDLLQELEKDGFDAKDARYLVHNYGRQTDQLLDIYRSIDQGSPKERMIRAEFQFACEHEMILNVFDFFIRRTGRMYFYIDSVREWLEVILKDYGEKFDIDPEQLDDERSDLLHAIEEHSNFSFDRV
ncbi:glycerol-3-phosphate dehydrogenase/oxidase [Robertkochia marina]|uniref:Glycerol-3-phosphate dehydrogenase/oxidase n=1 Tax=Robertkochia marina TaxID=1227945 RepID=A0A4S3M3J9_9FLAO|nr:glycerol-3-phosphate dehydrogenase/oxidase [Robertkochia marina]THD69460.1 glycerol-3-phosphate dehydrogenase/oxidase [Robertkochia marina]TRZ47279.1 glycerol-3-phosphate dehydrogenase/oxidase [Robertkochia marina]